MDWFNVMEIVCGIVIGHIVLMVFPHRRKPTSKTYLVYPKSIKP
jgi:hypothetical protein